MLVCHEELRRNRPTLIKKGITFKIYPNQKQIIQINKTIGSSRFSYNYLIDKQKQYYEFTGTYMSKFDMCKLLTDAKEVEETEFLKEADSRALQNTAYNLDNALKRYKDEISGFPRYKKKQYAESYTTDGNIELAEDLSAIKLPKLGWVIIKWRGSNIINKIVQIKRATVKRTSSGHFEVSLIIDFENQESKNFVDPSKKEEIVGIDPGVANFITLSTGQKYSSMLSHLEFCIQKQKEWQRKMARRLEKAKAEGKELYEAKNYQKARKQYAKWCRKEANIRKDLLHKISSYLVRNFNIIAIEDTKVKKLLHTAYHKSAHNIQKQAWTMFKTMLEYKCEWYGIKFVKVAPYYTTRMCNNCKKIRKTKIPTTIREWTCSECGSHNDRDINASKNIRDEGERIVLKEQSGRNCGKIGPGGDCCSQRVSAIPDCSQNDPS